MRNFSLLFQYLVPNAASTKFGVTKCRKIFLKLLAPKVHQVRAIFLRFNTKGEHQRIF